MCIEDSIRELQIREIELELIRVRSAAEAARHESRAAELELLLRRMARGAELPNSATASPITTSESLAASSNAAPEGQGGEATDSWSHRLTRLQTRVESNSSDVLPNFSSPLSYRSLSDGVVPELGKSVTNRSESLNYWTPQLPSLNESTVQIDDAKAWIRTDTGSSFVQSPHFTESVVEPDCSSPEISIPRVEEPLPEEIKVPAVRVEEAPKCLSEKAVEFSMHERSVNAAPVIPLVFPETDTVVSKEIKPFAIHDESAAKRSPGPIPAVQEVSGEDEDDPKKRFRPASWFVSTLAHLAVLVLLGFMTLANNPPKDQLAFTASASESSEETMETFSIESSEPSEPTEPVSETAYEISEMGTMAVTEVSMDVPPAPAAPSTSDLFSSSSSSLNSSLMKSLKGDSNAKVQFCGVDGGGNHFVYLVDSSGSMRDGFQSAREELLGSIDQLTPDQRFYVIFFDEEPAYMRIQDPNMDEPASVMATPENKRRLRSWAMTVEMNKGRAPYDVLPFALTLRPDVIFLLSDGEFPARIEEILREQNHEENLFGENGAISIVHTIRYHGVEGQVGRDAEATMVKIAKENGGQYRHVPKPK